MAPPHAVVVLGVDAASMGAALIMNLIMISLIEILGVALIEEDK
jgi:hypothetical protein